MNLSLLPGHLKTVFKFGTSQVEILAGDILSLDFDPHPQVMVVPEDNYLTMTSKLSRRLHGLLGNTVVQRIQAESPVRAGTVTVCEIRKNGTMRSKTGYVFFATVIDYDLGSRSLEELTFETCLESLRKTEENNLERVAIQVSTVDTPGMSMSGSARALCSAIKTYLAEERLVKKIWLVLEDEPVKSSTELRGENDSAVTNHQAQIQPRLLDFVREANAILGSPYDPQERIRQARDFFGREAELGYLEKLLTGQFPGKRHALLLGGPGIGKWMILDQLYYRSQLPGNPIYVDKLLVRVRFTALLPTGEASFLFRKLVAALIRHEPDVTRRKILRKAYASQSLNSQQFRMILDSYHQRSLAVIFLCDGFPQATITSTPQAGGTGEKLSEDLSNFYRALETIQGDTVFLISPHDENFFMEFRPRFQEISPGFVDNLGELWVKAVGDIERTDWVNDVYQRYLNTDLDAPLEMQRFVEEEAGNHPYLISLACHLLLGRMKRVALNSPQIVQDGWGRVVLKGIIEYASRLIVQPRKEFFDHLLESLSHDQAIDLYNLGRAVVAEEQTRILGPALAAGDPNAQERLAEILYQGDARDLLHEEAVGWLVNHGYVQRFPGGKAQFVIPAMAAYCLEKLGGLRRPEDHPADVTISLLHHFHPTTRNRPERSTIRTLFSSRGGQVIAAEKHFARDLRQDFMTNFNLFLESRRGRLPSSPELVFKNTEEIGNFLLSQYATLAVKRYLENPPKGCSINFLVDEALRDIPWELMLEAAYAGEIPFQVGRSIISNQPPGNVRAAVRGPGQVKALLIGNPTGDLPNASFEVEWLEGALETSDRFERPEILMGSHECQRIRVLNALSSGKFGLVHYSGHSRAAGENSAWILSDGEIVTDQLTSAVQAAPPALVFSSSCFSAASGASIPVEYENQAFDLPGAFLNAGVQAYIGTLWEVEEDAARRLVERFYTAFLNGDLSLGECLRRARQSLKLEQERQAKIDWLAFILYGDPRILPGDLYPAFRNQ